MSIILTGDLHLSINPRDEYRFTFLESLMEVITDRKPDRLIIAGDLTEEKDRHPAILVNRVVDAIYALAELVPVIMLEGNHDYKEEGHAFFEFIKRIPRVRWINRPTFLKITPEVLLLPHTNDYKKDWASIDLSDYPFIICHQTFNGANVGFGRGLDGIPLEILPKRSRTFAGDIHVPQQFGKNLVYIGAPYHVDFGDNYESRIIWIDDDPNAWESIDTSHLPQKRLIRIDDQTSLQDCDFNAGDLLKIEVEVDDMGGWLPQKDKVRVAFEERGARVFSISPKLIKKAVRRRHVVTDKGSDNEIVEAFGKRHDLTAATIKTGIKLL
jgi:DNA repair exonuclease SbcCD nuclease subunit